MSDDLDDDGLEDEDDDFETEDDELLQLEAIARFHNVKSVAYKTVDIFAGICRKRLWLKNGSSVHTDGHEIVVPFQHPELYRLVERQLAHILFRSDAKAKKAFVNDYSDKVAAVARKMGVTLDGAGLKESLDHIITVLEKRRVVSLWRLLYPGSYALMRDMDREAVEPLMSVAHGALLPYITCLEGDPEGVRPGELDRFRPYIEEALRKVNRRGFSATLSVSKWLVMQLVNQILRDLEGIDPPQPPPMGGMGDSSDSDQGDQDQASGGAGGDSGDGAGAAGGSQDAPDEEEDDNPDGGGNEPQDPSEDEESDDSEGDSDQQQGDNPWDEEEDDREPWNPPSPQVSGEDRTKALQQLISQFGDAPKQVKDPVKESKYTKSRHSPKAQAVATQALKAPVNNADSFEQSLEDSAKEMDELVDRAQQEMRQKLHHDEWLQKDAMAKVTFVDKTDGPARADMSFEDRATVERLRAMFHRVMGKRKSVLEEYGTEIDVQARIEQMTTGIPMPVFKGEGRGQGFKAMILVDRSGSMGSTKTEQCERACRIINRALRFPFVEVSVWGFTAKEAGEITLTRHDPKRDIELKVGERGTGGMTPLHVACRLGAKELDRGTECKQLFVLTDGFPIHVRRDGREFSTKQLMGFVRDEVRRARLRGVNVTGVFIGTRTKSHWRWAKTSTVDGVHYDVGPKQLAFMFGPKRCWSLMDPNRIGHDLVHLVSTSFIDFLRRR